MPKKKSAKTYKKPKRLRGGKLYQTGTWKKSKSLQYNNIQSIAWHGSPFPREMVTQVTYAQNVSLTSTAGVPTNYLFSSNSLYDCDVSGTGNQPRFYDTICGANNTSAPYQAYRVFACKVTCEFLPTGSDANTMRGFVGIGSFGSSQTGPSNLAEMRARADFKTKPIGYWSGGHDIAKISRFITIKSLFGVKDMKDDEDTAAAYNASPVKAGRICISYIPFDESSTRTIQVLVKIIYYCQFFQRNDVSDS